ncbi:MAG: hypothetical protein U5N58_02540 [Actinomycetota bacterium]|nr:hypothetical protein [Actinomycetota bacterium]
MAYLTKKEIIQGEKVVGGPKIYFWVISILAGIGTFSVFDFGNWLGRNMYIGNLTIGLPRIDLPIGENTPWVFLALYVVALVGLYVRKGWAIPVGRAALVVSMIVLFPVGTIFGAILWKRFNNPLAKRYLNYGYVEGSAGQENGEEKE